MNRQNLSVISDGATCTACPHSLIITVSPLQDGWCYMTKDEVAALKESLKADYQKNIEAIERVERLLAERQPTVTAKPEKSSANDVEDAATLKAAVEMAIRDYGDGKWKIGDILAHLKSAGHVFQAEDPYKSLHSTIWKLEKDGAVRVVIRGKGRQPNTYQAILDAYKPHDSEASMNGKN